MKKTYLVANWKSNKTISEARAWIQTVKVSLPKLTNKLEIIICAPFIHLKAIKTSLPQLRVGVQNISPYPDGAYTGEISARMLADLVDYTLVGHSERREYFSESNSQVTLKITQALEYDITPIVCLNKQNWRAQINQLENKESQKAIFMYEPPEAISQQIGSIGVGNAAPIEEVIASIARIKKDHPQNPVLYGGSVKSSNLTAYLQEEIIDGVIPGSASLNAREWLKLISLVNKIRG